VRVLLVLLLGGFMCHYAVADVPANRLATLSRGVNLIDIFSNKTTANITDEINAVHQAGFRHVRFFVDPDWVWQAGEPQRLDQIIHAAFAAKLGVIICMQSYAHPLKEDDAHQLATWTTAWMKIANHYADTNPDLLFFELLNEPPFTDVAKWVNVQETLRRQVRAVVPHHTLLLTGSPTSTASALAQIPLSSDDDVAYVFHIYAPMVFTHQGAEWASPEFATIHGLQYPPSYPNLTITENAAAPQLREQIAAYGKLGRGVINNDIAPALEWAQHNHARLIVTEFGVYRPFAPPASRAAWLHDVRTTLEKSGAGWTVWEYNGGFGIKQDLIGCGPLPLALGLCS
jgi:endoglucanase